MSGSIKTRSMAKGNEAARGDTSTTPDNPGNLRIRKERGHEARALSNNTTTTQMLVSSSSHRSIERGQNQSGSASSERPGSRCTMSNEARMMQRIASSTFDDYGAGNGPNTSGTSSNNARMVQTIAPSSLLSDNDAVPTGSGTATFQNVETTRTFALSSSIGHDEPGHMEDGPTPLFWPSSRAGTQQRGTGGLIGLPLHEMEQGLERKRRATSSWPSSHYDLRMDTGDATTASQDSSSIHENGRCRASLARTSRAGLPAYRACNDDGNAIVATLQSSTERRDGLGSRDGRLRGHTYSL